MLRVEMLCRELGGASVVAIDEILPSVAVPIEPTLLSFKKELAR
jgi:hypothetical protein